MVVNGCVAMATLKVIIFNSKVLHRLHMMTARVLVAAEGDKEAVVPSIMNGKGK